MALSDGHIWLITEGGSGLGNALALKLKEQGQKALILLFPSVSPIPSPVNDMITLTASTEDHLQETLKTIQLKFGPIAGFIHTHPLPSLVASKADYFTEEEMEIVQSVYFMAKHLKPSLNDGYFAAVTQVDGQLATSENSAYSVIGSGLSGLIKALNREWPNVRCRFLDLSPNLNLTEAADIVLEELADPERALTEVGRTKNERITLCLEPTKTSLDPQQQPNKDSLFLVTGGAKGITADCVLRLAQAYKCKFILLGRTPLRACEPEWAFGYTDNQQLQQEAIKYLTQNGHSPTPVEINRLLHAVSSQREINYTLSQIKKFGGEAVYCSADIVQKAELEKLLPIIAEHGGKITGIIHGAGNLADKRIEKKTLSDWHQVIEPKIFGLRNVLSIIDLDCLQYLILFSSVSGYFGNAGQTDYALANEILNKFAYAIHCFYPQMRVTSINWGPWEKGMMNNVLKKYYQEQGIDLIPVAMGTQFCEQEFILAKSHVAQQIVIGGALNIPAIYTSQKQQEDLCQRQLTEIDNPFLTDHKIGSNAVLPMTCAINWMVKNCQDQLPNHKARIIRDFQVLKGIRFAQNSEFLCVSSVKPAEVEKDFFGYNLLISSIAKDKDHKFHHYDGKIALSTEWETRPIYTNLNLEPSLEHQIDNLYGENGCLFHGVTFQGIQKVLQLNDRKITSLCRLPSVELKQQGQFAVNSFNPYVADVQLHNILIWTYYYLNQGCLPTGFAKIEQFYPIDFEENFYVSTEIIAINNIQAIVDIYTHDREGKIFMKWSSVSYTIMKQLRNLFWEKK